MLQGGGVVESLAFIVVINPCVCADFVSLEILFTFFFFAVASKLTLCVMCLRTFFLMENML